MTKPRSAKGVRAVLDAARPRPTTARRSPWTATSSASPASTRSSGPAQGRRKGATKRDLLIYLTRVSPYLLPHLADRPLFVTRFPDGVTGKSFFQKHWEPAPPFARTVDIHSAHNERDGAYLICENLATLL